MTMLNLMHTLLIATTQATIPPSPSHDGDKEALNG